MTATAQGTDWISTLIPVAAVLGLGYLAYRWLQQNPIINFDGRAGANYGSGPSQGVPTGDVYNITMSPSTNPNLSKGGAPTTPGFFNTGPGTPIQQGTGIGGLFVNTGPGTPNNFFPLGNVITTSRTLTNAEQRKVIQNLPSGIGGWWEYTTRQNEAGVVYTPITAGASPDNPIVTRQYDSPIGPVRP